MSCCTSGMFSRNLHWSQVMPTNDGDFRRKMTWYTRTERVFFYHYKPRSAAFRECQILRLVFLRFLWARKRKRSVYWLLLPKFFPGFYPNIPFWKLLFWDFVKKERAREARGILLPSHDALLDGFFDHLQGGRMKKLSTRTMFYVLRIRKSTSSIKAPLHLSAPNLGGIAVEPITGRFKKIRRHFWRRWGEEERQKQQQLISDFFETKVAQSIWNWQTVQGRYIMISSTLCCLLVQCSPFSCFNVSSISALSPRHRTFLRTLM